MPTAQLEERVAALEAEIALLKKKLAHDSEPPQPWWKRIGTFNNDPIFEKAMKLGAEYRRSLRPKPAKRSRKKDVRPRHRSS